MLSLDLVLLMFAVGALAAAVAAGFGAPVWIALPVFAIVSLLLLFLVRPRRGQQAARRTDPHDGSRQPGRPGRGWSSSRSTSASAASSSAGELWSARSPRYEGPFDTGTEVLVTQIDGATAVVTAYAPVPSEES